MAKLNIKYKLEVFDKDGELKSTDYTEGHSFVKQFLQLLFIVMVPSVNQLIERRGVPGAINLSGPDVDNLRTDPQGSNNGVIIGTGSAVVVITDEDLDTPVTDGVGVGQMVHGSVHTIIAPTFSNPDGEFSIVRSFTNAQTVPDTVIVAEVGLAVNGGTTANFFLAAREVLGVPVTVLDGETLNVTAEITITVT